MANSTNEKPHRPKDFPLFPHANGQWAKKIRGKLHYFGKWEDRNAALAKYLEQRDYLLAGVEPPSERTGATTVQDLCEQFLEAKKNQENEGGLSARSFKDYFDTCERLSSILGLTVAVERLMPAQFAELRKAIAKTRSPGSLRNEMQRIRVVFNWGEKSHLFPPVKYGPGFATPSKKQIRQHRQQAHPRYFTPVRVRALVKFADVHLRAMVLLGINCGWGNTDVATVPLHAFSLSSAFVDFPRPKTAIERRSPLWPETVDALRVSLAKRHRPEDPEDQDLFFVTKYGQRYVRFRDNGVLVDSISLIFGKLLRRLKIKQKGVNFYSLRHTFRTIADEVGDRPAIDRIMGHETPGMGTVYREWIRDQRENERLLRVTEHVRGWYLSRRT